MSLQDQAQALRGRLVTLRALAAVHAERVAQAIQAARESHAKRPRSQAKIFNRLDSDLAAADGDFFPTLVSLARSVEEFSRDAAREGHAVDGLLELLDARGDRLGLAIENATRDLRRIELVESERNPEPPETRRYREALELWNRGSSWPKVCEAVGEPIEDWRSFAAAVRRFADAQNLTIRKGTPGRKRSQ